MSDHSVQRLSELIRGVIEILWTRTNGLSAREVVRSIPETVRLTDYEKGMSPSTHTPRYERMVRLATLPLVKAGWLVKTSKGQWHLTADGRRACRRFSNPVELFMEALQLSETGRQNAPEILLSLELMQERAWEQIVKHVQETSAVDARRLVVALLEAMQYHVMWVAPPEKNRGMIDMVATVDTIGARSSRILVQVRHTGQPVTMEGLKSFHSILGGRDFGLLMSTGGFTTEAREGQYTSTYQKINAMDLEKFFDVWVKHYDRLSHEAHSLLPLKPIFFLFPQN